MSELILGFASGTAQKMDSPCLVDLPLSENKPHHRHRQIQVMLDHGKNMEKSTDVHRFSQQHPFKKL